MQVCVIFDPSIKTNTVMKTVTKTSMATGNVVELIDFTSEKKAILTFKQMADELGYINLTEERKDYGVKMDVGGIGHDYKLELYINNLVA